MNNSNGEIGQNKSGVESGIVRLQSRSLPVNPKSVGEWQLLLDESIESEKKNEELDERHDILDRGVLALVWVLHTDSDLVRFFQPPLVDGRNLMRPTRKARIIFAKTETASYGIEIIFDPNDRPLGMRYWSDAPGLCGFCGSIGNQCIHGPIIYDKGVMISWDLRCLFRTIISVEWLPIDPTLEGLWWPFNSEAESLANRWVYENPCVNESRIPK